ncbi:MAG: hypothetical protein KDC44_00415 [Phaeodactylibacter sp.]|nr:hypothetical protein [Phaeodactylibacter sp.]
MSSRVFALLFLPMVAGAQVSDVEQLCAQPWRLNQRIWLETEVVEAVAEEAALFLRFQEDGVAELAKGPDFQAKGWLLTDGKLWLALDGQLNFRVVQLDTASLVLEFEQKEPVRSLVQYHFQARPLAMTPFSPDYQVETDKQAQDAIQLALPMPPRTSEIQIELIGGGFLNVVEPVLYDYIQIFTDGRVKHEVNRQGLKNVVDLGKVDRSKVEDLAVFIYEAGFFEWKEVYDCDSDACRQRLARLSKPIPVRLSVRFGTLRKVVSIAIYPDRLGETEWVNYPSELDQIIGRVRTFMP